MDLTRISDPRYIEELRNAQIKQANDPEFVAGRLEILEELARQWGAGDLSRPEGLVPERVSTDEFVAVALAVHREREFEHPVAQFVLIAPWLQAWVLRKWKMEKYIGKRLGITDSTR